MSIQTFNKQKYNFPSRKPRKLLLFGFFVILLYPCDIYGKSDFEWLKNMK